MAILANLLANALETTSGTSTPANKSSAGAWRRAALAAEAYAGASTTANSNTMGYIRRTMLALEAKAGIAAPTNPTRTKVAYLRRIAAAYETIKGNPVSTSKNYARRISVSTGNVPAPGGGGNQGGGNTNAGVNFVWDTDLDSDSDDIAATALKHRLLDLTGGTLIASTTCSSVSEATPALKALNTYAGRDGVPVGAYKGAALDNTSLYAAPIRNAFRAGDGRSNYGDAVTVLTTALNAVPDQSVVVLCGGTLTNIAALITAQPALAAAKIKLISAMGGVFNSSSTPEQNINLDKAAAQTVANSGIPVVWAGKEIGDGTLTRYTPTADTQKDPYLLGWNAYMDNGGAQSAGRTRDSWDLVSVFYGIMGASTFFSLSSAGDVVFDQTTSNTTFTTPGTNNKNRYLVLNTTKQQLADALNGYIDAFATARDLTAPTLTSSATVNTTTGSTITYAPTGSEPMTVGLASTTLVGANFNSGILTAPQQAVGTFTATFNLTDAKGNTTQATVTFNITAGAAVVNYGFLQGTNTTTATTTMTGAEAATPVPAGAKMLYIINGPDNTPFTPADAAFWTQVGSTAFGTRFLQVFEGVRGASAPNMTFTRASGSGSMRGTYVAYTGVALAGALDGTPSVSAVATATTTPTAPGVTTSVPDALVVAIVAQGATGTVTLGGTVGSTNSGTGSNVTTAPAIDTWSERLDISGSNNGLAIFDMRKSTAGATGDFSATTTGSARATIAVAAFKPA